MAFRSLKPIAIVKKLASLSSNKAVCWEVPCYQIIVQKHFSSQTIKLLKPYSFGCRQNVASFLPARATKSLTTTPQSTSTEIEDDDVPDDLFIKIDVEVKGHDPEVLKSYEKFVSMTANELDITIGNISTPPKVITRRTLLKSVHIYKKHRVQYEWRTHFKVFEFKYLTGSTADTFLEYIQRNLPEGVAMKVTRHQLERLPEHIASAIAKNSKSPS